jgi:outer membrane receptor for ferrienterochelin and colicin
MAGVAEADPASPAAEESLDEAVIVTGERVLRSVRKTSSSVEVVSRQQLEATVGADRIEQALELVPNVEASAGGAAPVIRGQDATGPTRDLPAFLGGTRPRTTLIVDGRAVSYSEFVFGRRPCGMSTG